MIIVIDYIKINSILRNFTFKINDQNTKTQIKLRINHVISQKY